jgi:hypothetical protein
MNRFPTNDQAWSQTSQMGAQNQQTVGGFRGAGDERHTPRYKIKVAITVHSRSGGTLKGDAVDLSETGIAAMLMIEVPLAEIVELEFTLPFGDVKTYAVVRQKSAFRYGFQFVNENAGSEVIRATCRQLAMEESLLGGP